MNFAAEIVNTWGAAMWRASWQAGLVALAVGIVCWLVPAMPARFQCWLWRLAVLKFVVALVWAVPLELPLLPATASTTSMAIESSATLAAPMHVDTAHVAAHDKAGAITPWLLPFFAWMVIALWQMVRIAASYRRASELRKSCRPSDDRHLIDLLASLSNRAGLGTPPALLETAGRGSPLLIGLVRPAIVLPVMTLRELDASERKLVLAHELAHARRGDLAWGVFAAVVRGVFFFHPLAWLSERRLRLTQEIAADALAMSLEQHDAASYAHVLVSMIGKLGPARTTLAMSVGMAGSHQALKQRFIAMRFMKPESLRTAIACRLALGTIAVLGLVPWMLVAAEAPAVEVPTPNRVTARGAEEKQPLAKAPDAKSERPPSQPTIDSAKAVSKGATERGRFVSYQNGELTIQTNSGALLKTAVAANTQTLAWNTGEGLYKPANTTETLSSAKPGTWCTILAGNESTVVRIGSRKSTTIGTFVSFKEGRLLILGKNLGESFTKKYGNTVHFRKFRDDVPAYESIDGGDYQSIGEANKVLSSVKEGTIVVVHGEGDDNITRVDLGVKNP